MARPLRFVIALLCLPVTVAAQEEQEHGKRCKHQPGVAVYLHRSCLQPLPTAKPDGQNMMRSFDFGLAQATYTAIIRRSKNPEFRNRRAKFKLFNRLLV